ncbi:MAG: hypothetical protein QOH29_1871 [Actinomycetota bacterium]|nr:hypothetical protein [Actinomycetota bacterium]
MATPSETHPILEPPAREATISDLIATAFARYGGGFVTYGVAAVLLCAIPGAAVAVARSQHARFAVFAAVLAYFASLAYMLLAGLIAADAGRRVRRRIVAIVVTAPIAAIPVAVAVAALGFAALLVLPLVLAPCVLAAVAAGAGDASGAAAVRTGWTLAFGSFRRAAGLGAVVEVMGLLLWLGLFIALSPLGEGVRAGAAMVVWGAIFGPLSALVFRAFYGARTGRLVLLREPG